MTPNQFCENKLKTSGSNFSLSFIFLKPMQRQAMTALYAFCREVDDIVDHANNPEVAHTKLLWWKTEIAQLFANKASHPITQALQESLEHYPLEQQYFLDIISGMMMDLNKSRYENFSELKQYCYYAASAVGLLSIEIMGYQKQHQQSLKRYAIKLGIALQLTNILRDVKEDYERQRVYLPQEDFRNFSLQSEQISIHNQTDKFNDFFKFQSQRILGYYQQAYDSLPDSERSAQRMGLMMAAVYRQLLQKIMNKNYPVLSYRVSLNPFYKLWLIWKTARNEQK
ncbi:MAG: presqualene diphosphate synthase HpnD [Gammaproteobacteria bacterium]|nr:presqualene diphosphate synthase HpnD [Gammaproteobacteria bacterium]